MDTLSKSILAVIAAALCVIAFKLCNPPIVPTYGDFYALRAIENEDEKKELRIRLVKALPMVQVHGGSIDAEVTGSVSIDQ